MIADMQDNDKLIKIVNELFIRGRKLKIYLFLSCNNILKHQKMLN